MMRPREELRDYRQEYRRQYTPWMRALAFLIAVVAVIFGYLTGLWPVAVAVMVVGAGLSLRAHRRAGDVLDR